MRLRCERTLRHVSVRPAVVAEGRLQSELKFIAAIVERPVMEKILKHLGLEPQPPPRVPGREAEPHLAG